MATITKIKINGTTHNIGGSGGGSADLTELTTKVNNAQATATNAQTTADEAVSTATDAYNKADEALTLANEVMDYLDNLPMAEGGEF